MKEVSDVLEASGLTNAAGLAATYHHGRLLRSVLNLRSWRPTGLRGCGCEMCGATNVRDGTKPREKEREKEEACLSISMGAEGFTCMRTKVAEKEKGGGGWQYPIPSCKMPTEPVTYGATINNSRILTRNDSLRWNPSPLRGHQI